MWNMTFEKSLKMFPTNLPQEKEMTRNDVEAICLETMRTALNDYEMVKAELDLLKTGQTVILPVDKDHARYMLIVAMNYLGIEPGNYSIE